MPAGAVPMHTAALCQLWGGQPRLPVCWSLLCLIPDVWLLPATPLACWLPLRTSKLLQFSPYFLVPNTFWRLKLSKGKHLDTLRAVGPLSFLSQRTTVKLRAGKGEANPLQNRICVSLKILILHQLIFLCVWSGISQSAPGPFGTRIVLYKWKRWLLCCCIYLERMCSSFQTALRT